MGIEKAKSLLLLSSIFGAFSSHWQILLLLLRIWVLGVTLAKHAWQAKKHGLSQ